MDKKQSALRKGGRPAFQPTEEQRQYVSVGAAGGMSHEEIAIGLGIARMTLLKYFEVELSTAAYRNRLNVLNAMYDAAMKGNVAAQKAFLATTPQGSTVPLEAQATKTEPLGKKAQANMDAITAQVGTEWDDLLPMGNVVSISR